LVSLFSHADVSQEDLEASVPQSTFSGSSPLTPEGKKTQALARVLRVLLESLDDLHRERKNIVKRAQRLADADDISDRVLKEASKFDKMADIQPLMFEEASDEELAKYDKFLVELREFEEKQNSILADVKVRRVIFLGNEEKVPDTFWQKQNELFLQSRRDDPTIKDREFGLQSLEFAYFKYKEISRNLEEGYKVTFPLREEIKIKLIQVHSSITTLLVY
jgi:programmed cell death 6-interacting protein